MIVDANNLPDARTLRADVCIVGAGAAGISMALQFIGSGIEVLLLESGALEEEPDTQALYAGSVADERLHSPPDRYRQRRVGGTTTIWGGRCVPFDPIVYPGNFGRNVEFVAIVCFPTSPSNSDPDYVLPQTGDVVPHMQPPGTAPKLLSALELGNMGGTHVDPLPPPKD